jgi:hypothetical protein
MEDKKVVYTAVVTTHELSSREITIDDAVRWSTFGANHELLRIDAVDGGMHIFAKHCWASFSFVPKER